MNSAHFLRAGQGALPSVCARRPTSGVGRPKTITVVSSQLNNPPALLANEAERDASCRQFLLLLLLLLCGLAFLCAVCVHCNAGKLSFKFLARFVALEAGLDFGRSSLGFFGQICARQLRVAQRLSSSSSLSSSRERKKHYC